MVTVVDEFVLLAHRDVTGRAVKAMGRDYGVVAAILMELVLRERVEVDEAGEVTVIDATPCGHAAVDAYLALPNGDRAGSGSWLKQVRSVLVEQEILTHQRDKVLGLFPVHRYFPVDGRTKGDVRARLIAAVAERKAGDARTAALAAVIAGAEMSDLMYPMGSVPKALEAVVNNPPATQQTKNVLVKLMRQVAGARESATAQSRWIYTPGAMPNRRSDS